MTDEKKWYAIRVAYGREMRLQTHLANLEIETYLPTEGRFINTPQGKVFRQVALIPHVIFVYSTERELFEVKNSTELTQSMRYIMTRDGNKLVVPEKQLSDFRRVVEAEESKRTILDNRIENIKVGRRVLITEGQFAGIEGVIKRVNGNKSVVVTLAGLSYAAINFVPKAFMVDV